MANVLGPKPCPWRNRRKKIANADSLYDLYRSMRTAFTPKVGHSTLMLARCERGLARRSLARKHMARRLPGRTALDLADLGIIIHIVGFDLVHARLHHECLRLDKSVSKKSGGSSKTIEMAFSSPKADLRRSAAD